MPAPCEEALDIRSGHRRLVPSLGSTTPRSAVYRGGLAPAEMNSVSKRSAVCLVTTRTCVPALWHGTVGNNWGDRIGETLVSADTIVQYSRAQVGGSILKSETEECIMAGCDRRSGLRLSYSGRSRLTRISSCWSRHHGLSKVSVATPKRVAPAAELTRTGENPAT